jgi:transcriptional regulator of arginine metabolism
MRIMFNNEAFVMPGDRTQQSARREAILTILRESAVGRQEDLVAELQNQGHDATQSSVSRDLRELGVTKVGDRYLAPYDERPRRHRSFDRLTGFVIGIAAAGANLTVIQTAAGAAQSVAVALDAAGWPEIIGTISGDDTIFVATKTQRHQSLLLTRLAGIFPGTGMQHA